MGSQLFIVVVLFMILSLIDPAMMKNDNDNGCWHERQNNRRKSIHIAFMSQSNIFACCFSFRLLSRRIMIPCVFLYQFFIFNVNNRWMLKFFYAVSVSIHFFFHLYIFFSIPFFFFYLFNFLFRFTRFVTHCLSVFFSVSYNNNVPNFWVAMRMSVLVG